MLLRSLGQVAASHRFPLKEPASFPNWYKSGRVADAGVQNFRSVPSFCVVWTTLEWSDHHHCPGQRYTQHRPPFHPIVYMQICIDWVWNKEDLTEDSILVIHWQKHLQSWLGLPLRQAVGSTSYPRSCVRTRQGPRNAASGWLSDIPSGLFLCHWS